MKPPCWSCRHLLTNYLPADCADEWEPLHSCRLGYFELCERESIQEILIERLKMELCQNHQKKTGRKRTDRQAKMLQAANAYLKSGSIRAAAKKVGCSRQFVRKAIGMEKSHEIPG